MSVVLGVAAAIVVLMGRQAVTIRSERGPEAWPPVGIAHWASSRFGGRDIAAALPEFLEDMARSVRGGRSMRAAVGVCAPKAGAPLRDDLATVVARLESGAALDAAVHEWMQKRRDIPGVQLVGVALVMAATAGGSVAQTIDGVADTIRSELEVQAEVRAMASQAQASALLVAALPVVFGVVAGSTDTRTLRFLLQTRLGLVCLSAGIALDIGGWLWMRRITRSIAR